MDEQLKRRLRNGLMEVIGNYLQTEIDAGPTYQFPYFGDNTDRLMADAAVCILEAVYDVERTLVQEGMLDAEDVGI
jgi:hypothetical protein